MFKQTITKLKLIKSTLFKYSLAMVAIALVTGCASSVRTKVNTFIAPNAPIGTGSISVEPFDKAQTNSLEFKYYKDILENKLANAGYTINNQSPQYVAKLGYSVVQKESDSYRSGRVVFGSSFGYSHFYGNRGLFFSQQIENRATYERLVKLTIEQAKNSNDDTRNILEISARSVGSCESLTTVFSPMLDGIFSNLARPNGSVVTVKASGKGGC